MNPNFLRLSVILLLTLIICGLLFGFSKLFTPALDFQIHDTYLVISPVYIILTFFLVFSALFYLIRQLVTRFAERSANWVMLATSVGVLLILFMTTNRISGLESEYGDWVVYPPLSALPATPSSSLNQVLVALLLLKVLAALFVVSYSLGIRIRSSNKG